MSCLSCDDVCFKIIVFFNSQTLYQAFPHQSVFFVSISSTPSMTSLVVEDSILGQESNRQCRTLSRWKVQQKRLFGESQSQYRCTLKPPIPSTSRTPGGHGPQSVESLRMRGCNGQPGCVEQQCAHCGLRYPNQGNDIRFQI